MRVAPAPRAASMIPRPGEIRWHEPTMLYSDSASCALPQCVHTIAGLWPFYSFDAAKVRLLLVASSICSRCCFVRVRTRARLTPPPLIALFHRAAQSTRSAISGDDGYPAPSGGAIV